MTEKKTSYVDRLKQQSKQKTTKDIFEDSIEEFKEILKDQIHPDNQSASYKENEIKVLKKIIAYSNELDNEMASGEGIYSLIILGLRSILLLKNENIKLKKEISDLKKETKKQIK